MFIQMSSRAIGLGIAGLALAVGVVLTSGASDAQAGNKSAEGALSWRSVAKKVRSAARTEAKGDYLLALARAGLLTSLDERREAESDAREEYAEAREEIADQYDARLELAELLDEDRPVGVDVNPANFVAVIDNPFMPLVPGTTRTYRAEKDDGTETIVVTVLDETREILGVTCTVVRDTVSIDDELVEDTFDWFAQDKDGNVWYFGEIALNYEDGQITDVDGSWEAGRDGAQPGIVMPAVRTVGLAYRQEFLLGEAEDYAQLLSLDATVDVPWGSFTNCLKTFDGTPLEPDAQEHKYYAEGVGVVLEVDVESGERVELIDVSTD